MRSGVHDHLIRRSRLVEAARGSRLVLLEAPGGYGKSTLAAELAVQLDRPTVNVAVSSGTSPVEMVALVARGLVRAGMAGIAAALTGVGTEQAIGELVGALDGSEQGITLLVDEVHRLEPATAEWLAGLVDAIAGETTTILGGRRLGPALAALIGLPGTQHLTIDDLRFSEKEIAEVLARVAGRAPSPAEVAGISARTDGWPAAVALAAARLGRGRPVEMEGPPSGLLERLVEGELSQADSATRVLVADLAKLPLLSAEAAAAVGGHGALDRLLDLGLPVRFRRDGWGELPDSLRELLAGPDRLPLAAARAVATIYARRGELGEAVALLIAGEDHEGLVGLLAVRPRADLAALGLPFLRVLLERIPDEPLAEHVELLVAAALEAEHHSPELRPAWLARADRLAPATGPLRRKVDAEKSRELGREGQFEAAIDLATGVIDASASGEELARGRAHLTRGITALVVANGNANAAIVADIEAAVALFRLAGETRFEAEALQTLGVGVYQTGGSLARAEEALSVAVALLSEPDRKRGLSLTYLAEAATQRGNLAAAETANREAQAIGIRLSAADVIGYAAWSQGAIAAQRRDRRGVDLALAEALANPGTWFERPAGIDFLADASTMRLLVGDLEGARRDLDLAEQRALGTGYSMTVLVARARLEATAGDVQKALRALDELDRVGIPRDRCLYELLRAVCSHRQGDPAGAERHLVAARHRATVIGDPERLERREPELLALIDASGPVVVPVTRVRLLGAFEVRCGPEDVTPAPGRPSTLVKLIAMHGTMNVEEVIDLLWEEADVATGRARLRNLLNRVRTSSGGLIERRGEALALAAGIEVDVAEFERAVTEVLSAPASERVGLARRALAAYAGRLLPGDLYEDWAAAPRERLQRRFLYLADLLATDALERGNLDEAIHLLDEAIMAEPMDLDRYALMARALHTQGRRASAAGMVKRGLTVAEELGTTPPPELVSLSERLRD